MPLLLLPGRTDAQRDSQLAHIAAVLMQAHLLAVVPPRCIVLLEDVDGMHTNMGGDSDKKALYGHNGLSRSGLLNAIDGVVAADARILIMTTNHVDKLDPALIRPGRVDVKICLPLASKYQVITATVCLREVLSLSQHSPCTSAIVVRSHKCSATFTWTTTTTSPTSLLKRYLPCPSAPCV